MITSKLLKNYFYYKDGLTQLNYATIGNQIANMLVTEALKNGNNSDAEAIMNCLLHQQKNFYYLPRGVQVNHTLGTIHLL